MRKFTIRREEEGALDVVYLDGALDSYSFPRLESMLNELQDANRHKVILECEHLDYISSAALGALIGFTRRAREQGGDMKLVQLSAKILNIIELLGFHKILDIHADLDEARNGF
jgi:anti-sigma B factor antagonist